jgi:hypothetical protein
MQQSADITTDSNLPQPTLTFGEKAVGITFNIGGSPQVHEIKRRCGDLIDEIADQRAANPNPDKWDMYTEAIRRIQEGQMWAVKAATWQY